MSANKPSRKPRSLRKHLRRVKADLRRTLGPEEAERSIRHLTEAVRRRPAQS